MKGATEGPLAGIWPPGRLELSEWRELLEALAADAERMIGRPGTLQQSCTLALRWVGLCWPAMSPEVIAASCRASLQLGDPPGVVVGLPLADQLQEIAERMGEIYDRALADPSALAVEVRPPVLLAAPGVLPEPPPYSRPGPRKREPDPEPDPVEVIELPAEVEAPRPADMWGDGVEAPAQQLEHSEPIEPEALEVEQLEQQPDVAEALPVVIEPLDQPEPQQLDQPDPLEVAAELEPIEPLDQPEPLQLEHTTPEPEAQQPEALEDAPADPAPQVVEQPGALPQAQQPEPEPEPEPEALDPSPVPGMPPGWVDVVAIAAAVGLCISAVQRAKGDGRLLEGRHWRKAPPGLKLPGARKPLRTIWHMSRCLEVLGTATASERISAEQLRAKVRQTLREQGRRRRERRKLAADALAELQAEGQPLKVEQPTESDPPAAAAAPEALEVIEPLQQPDPPPAASPEVPPEVLAAAVAQALQQLGIKTQPAPSTNGQREPAPSCWAD
jgi:hypothetical protein